MADKWQNKGKYEQHIRLPTRIFEDRNFLAIPIKQRAYCLSILICLLKFLNSKTLQCYPRVQTLVSMTGLSKRSVFRCLTLLVKANIISKKRLKSTSLYTLNSSYVVSTRHLDMPVRHPLVPVSHVLEESFIRTNYNNKVDEIISRGLPKDVMINNLALLPLEELKQSMKNHPYYIPKAIERKEELNRQKNLVPVEKIISALKNTGKKTNSAYKYTVSKNKKYHIKPWENKKWEN